MWGTLADLVCGNLRVDSPWPGNLYEDLAEWLNERGAHRVPFRDV